MSPNAEYPKRVEGLLNLTEREKEDSIPPEYYFPPIEPWNLGTVDRHFQLIDECLAALSNILGDKLSRIEAYDAEFPGRIADYHFVCRDAEERLGGKEVIIAYANLSKELKARRHKGASIDTYDSVFPGRLAAYSEVAEKDEERLGGKELINAYAPLSEELKHYRESLNAYLEIKEPSALRNLLTRAVETLEVEAIQDWKAAMWDAGKQRCPTLYLGSVGEVAFDVKFGTYGHPHPRIYLPGGFSVRHPEWKGFPFGKKEPFVGGLFKSLQDYANPDDPIRFKSAVPGSLVVTNKSSKQPSSALGPRLWFYIGSLRRSIGAHFDGGCRKHAFGTLSFSVVVSLLDHTIWLIHDKGPYLNTRPADSYSARLRIDESPSCAGLPLEAFTIARVDSVSLHSLIQEFGSQPNFPLKLSNVETLPAFFYTPITRDSEGNFCRYGD